MNIRGWKPIFLPLFGAWLFCFFGTWLSWLYRGVTFGLLVRSILVIGTYFSRGYIQYIHEAQTQIVT